MFDLIKINKLEPSKLFLLLKKFIDSLNNKNFVLGLSGGIDSAVCLAILKKCKANFFPLVLPCNSSKQTIQDAMKIIDCFQIKDYSVIDLTSINDSFIDLLKPHLKSKISSNTTINLPPRLRMVALYAYANQHKSLVVNTSNYSEYFLGYCTKFGDNVGDISLLNLFFKSTVYRLAEYLNIPPSIISKQPSADLFPNQTDLQDLKISSYVAIEKFIKKEKISTSDYNQISFLNESSEHKRKRIYSLNDFLEKINDLEF